MNKFKVLVITNPLNHEGGVVNYYNLFFKHFDSEKWELEHHSIGSRAYLFYYPKLKRLVYPFYYIYDVLRFIILLGFNKKIKIVQVSPSLIPVPLVRDGLLVFIAKLLGKKVVVFYRGWKLPTLNRIKNSSYLKYLFNSVFQKNTKQVVLASSFKKDLQDLMEKNKNEIYVTKTAIDKTDVVTTFSAKNDDSTAVLFLGRIQNLKGINELVEAICQLNKQQQLSDFKFSIVGHEDKVGYIKELQQKLNKNGVSKEIVSFPGRVVGQDKFQMYASNDVFILPSYTEGCPNSVLEALASGLYCITTDVGALPDIIVPTENGLLIEPKSVQDIIDALLKVRKNTDYTKLREARSKKYSELFDIGLIIKNFEKLYNEIT